MKKLLNHFLASLTGHRSMITRNYYQYKFIKHFYSWKNSEMNSRLPFYSLVPSWVVLETLGGYTRCCRCLLRRQKKRTSHETILPNSAWIILMIKNLSNRYIRICSIFNKDNFKSKFSTEKWYRFYRFCKHHQLQLTVRAISNQIKTDGLKFSLGWDYKAV